jgi:transcriptional regulator with XRE-family HTH domain
MTETTFGQRVKVARELRRLTQGDVARLLEVEGDIGRTLQSVSSWENAGKTPPLEVVWILSKVLRVRPMWLAFGNGDIENEDGTSGVGFRTERGRPVPRLSIEAAVMDRNHEPFSPYKSHTWFDCGPNSFAIDIKDRSNEPRFTLGDAVVIDPDERPLPGDMVLAVLSPDQRPVFRKYAVRSAPDTSKYVELQPLNPSWEVDVIRSSSDGRIIGVMTEHACPRR